MSRPLLLLPLVAACAAPSFEPSEFRHEVALHVEDAAGAHARLIASIDSAERTLDVALPAMEDTALSDAILRAQGRGVEIRAITDVDRAEDAGAVALVGAGVPLRLADPGMSYFEFGINMDVGFASELVRMTHAWALVDRERATVASFAGTLDAGTRTVIEVRGEDLLEDLWTEHNQVFGGLDATATTAFDDTAKSIADWRWSYPTDSQLRLELWFGPQERLTKRVIDAVYAARSSVWIASGKVENEGLARVMQWKARDDFDVRVVVGPDQPETYLPRSAADLFVNQTPAVTKRQVADAVVPTIVVIDAERARDGVKYPTRVMILSHELVSARRIPDQPLLDTEGRAVGLENDQLIDGNLWVLNDWDSELHPDVAEAIAVFEDLFDRGEAL
jgi:hypothetical protein